MRTLHMLHTLDAAVGEETSTVRNGFKWADLGVDEEIELCVCSPNEEGAHTHDVQGIGRVTGLWFGYFSDIPARFIANEHEVRSRNYFGLLASMRHAYGAVFTEHSTVTVVMYERVE